MTSLQISNTEQDVQECSRRLQVGTLVVIERKQQKGLFDGAYEMVKSLGMLLKSLPHVTACCNILS